MPHPPFGALFGFFGHDRRGGNDRGLQGCLDFLSGRVHGTGLGLAVCKGIVRSHGGAIEVQPRDGGGSEFVVELPRSGGSGV